MNELMTRRRALMAQQGGGLPSAYQQVEWIENTNKSAELGPTINTGIAPALGTSIKCKMQKGNSYDYNGYPALFGAYAPKLMVSVRTTTTHNYMTYGNSGEKTVNFDLSDALHEIAVSKTTWAIDGVSRASYNVTAMDAATSTIHIFGRGSAGGGYSSDCAAKCAYFQIYDDDELVFDGIPCYRKSDGVIGMFDLVSKTFLTNAGSGAFTKGADVN